MDEPSEPQEGQSAAMLLASLVPSLRRIEINRSDV
jgi:hypothetical protein